MLNKPENLHPSAIRAKQDDINNTVYPIKNKNNHILAPVHPSILKRSQKNSKINVFKPPWFISSLCVFS